MVAVSGLVFPRTDLLYQPAYIAAITFALATPMAVLLVAPRGLLKHNRSFLWLFLATVVSAACAAVTGGLLLSMGSPAGAVGDIGGLPMWLLSTAALITSTMFTLRVWRTVQESPPTTLRGLQRQERRAKHHQR